MGGRASANGLRKSGFLVVCDAREMLSVKNQGLHVRRFWLDRSLRSTQKGILRGTSCKTGSAGTHSTESQGTQPRSKMPSLGAKGLNPAESTGTLSSTFTVPRVNAQPDSGKPNARDLEGAPWYQYWYCVQKQRQLQTSSAEAFRTASITFLKGLVF
eukprot:1178653-Prorocentrum_minimum.AAC.4